jgi:hypothetical protein
MDAERQYTRDKHLTLLEKSMATLEHILRGVTREQATTLRDGENGWTTLEIVCHLRDYEQIFTDRFVAIRDQDKPQFTANNIEQMAIDRAYNAQDMDAVMDDFRAKRQAFLALCRAMSDDDWARVGVHPTLGDMSMLRMLIQTAHHQPDHIEQITRVLLQR